MSIWTFETYSLILIVKKYKIKTSEGFDNLLVLNMGVALEVCEAVFLASLLDSNHPDFISYNKHNSKSIYMNIYVHVSWWM